MNRSYSFFCVSSWAGSWSACICWKPEDSRVLSKVCLYLVTPCVIINAFQLQRTPELLQGLALSLGAAIGIHALFFIATALLHRPLRLTPVEQASLIYTNSGNLIIPW